MATRRMISKSYSYSIEFNSLSSFEQVLFLMITPHLDDFGKIEGETQIVKARVLPSSKASFEDFETAIRNIEKVGLIERYEIDGRKYIRYPKFEKEQTGLNKRTISDYPDPGDTTNSKTFQEVPGITTLTEEKRTKTNRTELNISEENKYFADKNIKINELASPVATKSNKMQQIGDILRIPTKANKDQQINNYQQKSTNPDLIGQTNKNEQILTKTNKNEYPEDPNLFSCKSASEVGAKTAWQKLEPNNPRAFYTTYLSAAHKGLPENVFHLFISEIKQSNAKYPGAVFNSKVKSYFEKKGNTE